MSPVGTGTCGRAVAPDGNGGVVRPGALTAVSPSGVGAAEMRSWSLAGEGGTGLVARTARRRRVTVVLAPLAGAGTRSEEHTSELQSQSNLVCRLLLEKKKKNQKEQECIA